MRPDDQHNPDLRYHIARWHPERKVRILGGGDGTASTTRVLIDMYNDHHRWTTVGSSTNIIEASWQALVDGIEYGLMVA